MIKRKMADMGKGKERKGKEENISLTNSKISPSLLLYQPASQPASIEPFYLPLANTGEKKMEDEDEDEEDNGDMPVTDTCQREEDEDEDEDDLPVTDTGQRKNDNDDDDDEL